MWLLAGLALLAYVSSSLAQDEVVAFTATKTGDLFNVSEETIVVFEEVSANSGGWYNPDTGGFNGGGNTGNYYISFSIGIPQGRTVDTGLYWTDSSFAFAGLEFTNTFSNGSEYSSRGYMQEFSDFDDSLNLRVTEGSYLLGAPELSTSWSAFKYGDQEAAAIAFSVGRSAAFFGSSDAVDWGRTFINDGGPGSPGGPMEPATGTFTAPRFGYYFFHWSAGSVSEQPVNCHIIQWPFGSEDQVNLFSLRRTATSTVGTSTLSRSIIIQLNMYDEVTIGNDYGSYLDSSFSGVQTSFSGFLYSLQVSLSPDAVVFCAYMSNWEYTGDTGIVAGWTEATVNMAEDGAPFDLGTGVFTAPVASTYFFSFSIGVPWRGAASVWLEQTDVGGSSEIAHIFNQNTFMNGDDLLSRDVLVDLEPGDTVRMYVGAGSSLISSGVGRETAFLGFLVRS